MAGILISGRSEQAKDPRLRVLLLSPAFPPSTGGIERTAAELARGLNAYRLEVVSGRPTRERGGMASPHGVKVHWAANDPPYGRRATIKLIRLATRVGLSFRPSVVLAMHTRTMPAARALHHLIGSRVVLVVHAKELCAQPELARAALRWADGIVSVSEHSYRLAIEAGGVSRERVQIIHPGVTAPPSPPLPLDARPGPPTVLTVARMEDPHKGHEVALEAMARLRTRIPDARWVMVGDGSLRADLLRKAEALGLGDCVSWHGVVDDCELHNLFGTAHAFCLPSREPPDGAAGEGFGIVFTEAGAHRLPVVAGDVPGVVEAVRNGVTGLLVKPSDADAVAAALEQVLANGAYGQRLADAGRARAEELSWPLVVDRYRKLIDTVLAGPPQSQPCRPYGWVHNLLVGPRPCSRLEPSSGPSVCERRLKPSR